MMSTGTWISKGSANLLSTIDDLPLELIDIILQKCYLFSIQGQKESLLNQIDEVVIQQLASVDFCWFQRITSKRFKNVAWSMLKKYYEDKCKLYLVYKNNQQFFEEIHQISDKTRTTLSTDHLSHSETANGKRRRSLKKQKTENQMLRTAFLALENEDHVFKNFLSSYYPKEQKLICDIINTLGGGAARIEIKMFCPLTKFELIPQQFEDKEMNILGLLADRDAVGWIWCHSNNALQKLNNCDGLKKVIEIIHQSVKATSDVLEPRTNIDFDHLKKEIPDSTPLVFVNFRTKLNFYGENLNENICSYSDICRVIDVTKLKMKIYVLCLIRSWGLPEDISLSTMICVFEAQSPYPIVDKKSLKEFSISEFKSIVSSSKENCLYILTSSNKENHWVPEYEVIRFEIKENEENSLEHHSEWLKLEEGYCPSVLSISRDGYLMMVNRISPIILRIYDSDARLRLSVKLHEDISEMRKALETSNGNFIIMHSMTQQTEDKDDSICGRMGERAAWAVSEVSRDGNTIIRRFIPQNQQQQPYFLFFPDEGDLCTDSRDHIFEADSNNDRIIFLDAYLRWIGSLILQVKNGDENEEHLCPMKLFYDKDSHEMIITGKEQVFIYDLICK